MYLTYRPPLVKDLETCSYFILDRFAYDESMRKHLVEMWDHLVSQRKCTGVVVEERTSHAGPRPVGFGMGIFITDAFCEEVRMLPPVFGAKVLDRWMQGNSPILGLEAIRRANSGEGLNLLVLHYGWMDWELNDEDQRLVRDTMIEAFFLDHAGYKLKELLQLVYGKLDLQRSQLMGFLLRNDYADGLPGRASLHPPGRHPYLMGCTQEEALSHEGNQIYSLFLYSPPRFYFSSGQQEMMEHALKGETDEQTAQSLYLSPWTIKKRWNAIYRQVAVVDPELLPVGEDPSHPQRGAERRRHLLNYLRIHPEELRPVLSPRLNDKPGP